MSGLEVMAGSVLKIRFEMGTDGCNGRIGWYLDDITIYSCECTETLNLASTLNSQQLLLESEVSIMSTDTITGSSHIIYSAGQELNFIAGFEVNTGSQMEARMEGCSTILLNHGSVTTFFEEQSQEVTDYSSLNTFYTFLLNGNKERSEKILLEIFSMTGVFIGQTDLEISSNTTALGTPLISTLSKGLYQAKFTSKDSISYFKFVVD